MGYYIGPSGKKYCIDNPLNWQGIKRTPGVYPIIGCIGLGFTMAIAYALRMALFSPDVTWDPKNRTEPWQAYENRQYKFMEKEEFDYKNYIHPRPRF